ILVDVVALANHRTERVVRIVLHCLHGVEGVGTQIRSPLVGVEEEVHTIAQAILVPGHTFEVVGAIHSDSNLRVPSATERYVVDAWANVDHTVGVATTILRIGNRNSLGVDRTRSLETQI